MFENRIKLHYKHYDMSGHVWTCLRIVSNCTISIKKSQDMFENHIKSHHKHYDMSEHVRESYQIASLAL